MSISQNKPEAFLQLEKAIYAALETYSNVHRGSGHKSMITTRLFDLARDLILEYLGFDKSKYVVIFCSPRNAKALLTHFQSKNCHILSSNEFGLSLGIRAFAVKRKEIPKDIPFQTGGGTTRLISTDWVIWSKAPDRFEAGTPAIINVIAFAKALQLLKQSGDQKLSSGSTSQTETINDILYQNELLKYSGQELLDKLRKTLIGQKFSVPTQIGEQSFINLDNSASTPTFKPIWEAWRKSLHLSDQAKTELIQEVKTICSKQVGAPLEQYDIIYTSNTTEAINLVAENLNHSSKEEEPVVLNSLLEHSSNDLPWRMIPNHSLIRLMVNTDGFIDLEELETLLLEYNQKKKYGKKKISLVSISGASNVLGSCNNIAKVSQIVHKYGARLMVDAAQLVAHREINMEADGIDFLAFSAHKVYAPFGTGVLVTRKESLSFQSEELRLIQSSGEENVAGIAALGKAFVLLQKIGMEVIQSEEKDLTAYTLQAISQVPGIKIHGIKTADHTHFDRKLGVIVFDVKGMMADQVAKKLAMQNGIGVRYGCHCSHIIVKHILNVGPGLERFQRFFITLLPKQNLPGVTRVSLGIENSIEDIDRLVLALKNIKDPEKNVSDLTETPLLSATEVKKKVDAFITSSVLKVY